MKFPARYLLAAALVMAPACKASPPKPGSSASPSASAPMGGAAGAPTTPASAAPLGEADARAASVAQALTDAMGGQETWNKLPYFRFDFVVVRDGKEIARFKHWWDKAHGRCRVEGPDDKGRMVTAIFTLADKKGRAFVDGAPDLDSASVAGIIENGYERWVNDTYWVIMPFKLRDPGTHLKYDRTQQSDDGNTYDVLALSFSKGVGLTPDDHYWLYVNQKTHLIDKWEMVLTGQKPPPSSSTWESWTDVGPLKLSLARRFAGKPVMLRFENVGAPVTMDESVFSYSKPTG
jgi:hypothetical protein